MNFKWIRTRKKSLLWQVGLLLIVVIAVAAFLSGGSVSAVDRADIEFCGDGEDNDGDGLADEAACRISTEGSPTSTLLEVTPELWGDNPSCQDLGYSGGFKIEGQGGAEYTGTFPFDGSNGGILTGDAVSDPNNSVTLTSVDGVYLDWTSTIGIDAVFMKGGNGGNAYIYDPEAMGDEGLATPGAGPALSHVEFCYDYELDVSKDANTSFTRTYDWDITKDPDADYVGFPGDSWDHEYTITVNRTDYTDSDWTVEGTITIENNTPFDAQIAGVSDVIADYGPADTLDCGVSIPYTLPAGQTLECSYSAGPIDSITNPFGDTNTATVSTATDSAVGGGEASADVIFSEDASTITEVYPTVNVTDDYGSADTGDDKTFGPLGDGGTAKYSRTFECSTNPDDYENGTYSDPPLINTAEIDETGDFDTATVTVTCYAPVVTKDVTPAWEEFYDWDIFKNVDNTEFVGFVGDAWVFNYDIDVELTTYDQRNFSASGTIDVVNPHPTAAMDVGLTDAINGFNGVITADGDCAYAAGILTVPADSTATCDYSVDMGDGLDNGQATEYTNTATATIGGGSFSGTASFTFGDVSPTLAEDSEPAEVTATDDDATPGDTGDDHHSTTISGTTQDVIKYSQGDVCPTDTNAYINGEYTLTLTNIAVIDQTDDSDTETVNVTCYIPAKAKVVKTTDEGSDDIGQFPFTFELYNPSGALVESKTLGTGGGTVEFDAELKTEGTWTVKEVLPDGWVSTTDLTCTFDVAYPGSAGQTYTCTFDNVEKSRVDLLKLTNGLETVAQTWSFALYLGPDGFGTESIATDSTPPALLDFGLVNLDPFATYTLCELEVPAGYSTFWQVNGTTVLPYNPNADDDPPEDLGNRCVDFGAGTGISLVPGETLHFVVDNQMPGGAPRTPGYWKNWNRCTNGGQQYTADANGGWQEGFWLLEDVLDPAIGGGIVWDDILTDDFLFPITTCEVAVDILDKRAVGDPDIVGDGKKEASDPLHNLATHLLAAQLNFGAGACTTQEVLDAALAAEILLDQYNFDGNGHDNLQKKDPDADLANQLASYLDEYNNGEICGDGHD